MATVDFVLDLVFQLAETLPGATPSRIDEHEGSFSFNIINCLYHEYIAKFSVEEDGNNYLINFSKGNSPGIYRLFFPTQCLQYKQYLNDLVNHIEKIILEDAPKKMTVQEWYERWQ